MGCQVDRADHLAPNVNLAKILQQVAAIDASVNELDVDADWARQDIDYAVELWDRLDKLITNAMIVRRDHGVILARRIPDEYTTADGLTVHRTIETHHEWDGHAVLGALAQPLVNIDTGEMVEAIPLADARDVIPACGQGATSSKWKITELRKRLDPTPFHKVEYGSSIIARGPNTYTRNKTPKTPSPQALTDEPEMSTPLSSE